MFSPLLPIVTWLFSEIKTLTEFVWEYGSWLGVGLICAPLFFRVVHIIKKLF